MYKYLKKILLLFLLAFAIVKIISVFMPYHYGNVWYSAKMNNLNKVDKKFNTFFFGSSRFYRQVNPVLFDQEISDCKVKSYNLAAPATFCPQNYYLLENFLDSEPELNIETKFCFIELMDVDTISPKLLHQERTNYFLNTRYFTFALNSIKSNRNLSKFEKYKSIKKYLTSFIEKQLNLGHFSQQLIKPNYYNEDYVGINGFYPLETELEQTLDLNIKNNLIKRNLNLNKKGLLNKCNDYDRSKKTNAFIDQIHAEKIRNLIKKYGERNIKIIFVLAPRNISPSLIKLYDTIEHSNKINLCDPEKYPEFYSISNSFDLGHLNINGSEIFTKALAFEFKKMMN